METISNFSDNSLNIESEGSYVLDLKEFNETLDINVRKNVTADISFTHLNEETKINFFLQKDSNLNVHILYKNDKKSAILHSNLDDNATIRVYFADFSDGDSKMESYISLLGKRSRGEFKFASLTKNDERKKYNICFSHLNDETVSRLEGYGVCTKESFLTTNGITHIEKNVIKGDASQKIKAILFDEHSRAIANPILKIDSNDVIANHACAIGSLNQDHIFYLLSRGVSLEEARKLIILGYLTPIKEYFNEEDKKVIEDHINGDF